MRSCSKDEEVLRALDLSVAGNVAVWIIVVWVGVDFRVTESGVDRGNDHGA